MLVDLAVTALYSVSMNDTNSTSVHRCHIPRCESRLDTVIFLTSLTCFTLWFIFTFRWLIKNRDLLAMIADPRAFWEARRCRDEPEIGKTSKDDDCVSLSEFEIDIVLEASPKRVVKA